MDTVNALAALLGRVFLAGIFLWESTQLLGGYADAVAYVQTFGVPGALMPLVVLLFIVGGLMVVAGWHARLAAIGFAGFCLLTALIFHRNWADLNESLHFGKDIAISGGFLVLFANGPGAFSFDAARRKVTVMPR